MFTFNIIQISITEQNQTAFFLSVLRMCDVVSTAQLFTICLLQYTAPVCRSLLLPKPP